ncbi:X-Pro dipeptidyl-peptidase [Streptomyces yokosukanensis]|uniref:X-Pro dipeptidyl-peptidase n=1 Tax=Streptomyces yokosukanensis TaxID=67386 RepID=A0A124HE42_9ACTN|nr:CocE/NonD family hydrolase [Streptomyces yokosukanensis]KUM99516.1 X-Pro dipeptidyl-peptidase [Streptomyces yokosukanensis]
MKFTVDVDVQVPVADGTHLATNLWRPEVDEGTAFPTLLVRLPYGKDNVSLYGGAAFPNIFTLVEAGYAVAVQDCRGTYRSEGIFTPHLDDASDGADTVRWLTAQPWCNGAVGSYGASYVGFDQWQTASTGVEGLKAIAPAQSTADFYRAPWYSPGGAMSLECGFSWAALMSVAHADRELAAGRGTAEDLTAAAELMTRIPAALETTPLVDHPVIRKQLPWFITDVCGHPSRDKYWRDLAAIERVEEISTPALILGGWYDLFIGETVNAYTEMRRRGGSQEAREGQLLVIGPWAHSPGADLGAFPDRSFGAGASMQMAEVTQSHVRFFDRWLKGSETALDDQAPVRIFVMGRDEWRSEQEWPLPDTRYTDFYLGGGGRANTSGGDGVLSQEAPEASAQETYLYDPRRPVPTTGGNIIALSPEVYAGPADQSQVEEREDVLCFTTPVLEHEVEATGHVSLTLFVSSSAVDTDFTGKLVDVHPDGRAINLCEGIQRARYRESLAEPEFMRPGEIYELTLDLCVTSNVFLPGHRIRLEVSSSNFPRYDRNSNSGGTIAEERLEDMVPALNHIHHGPSHPSRLTLPLIERGTRRAGGSS